MKNQSLFKTKEELRNEKEKIIGAAFDCKQMNLVGSKDQKEYGRKRLKKVIQESKLPREEIIKACKVGVTINFKIIKNYLDK